MPHIAFADTGSAAASLLNGLNAAAEQQAVETARKKRQDTLDQQALAQRGFENEDKLRQQGGQPNSNSGSTHPGAPSLKLDDQNPTTAVPQSQANTPDGAAALSPSAATNSPFAPPQGGGGQWTTEPVSGRQYYMPSKSEQEQSALNDSNSFVPTGQLGAMMESAGWKHGARVKPTDSHSILMALNEAQPKDEPYSIDSTGRYLDGQGNPTAVMIGQKTGKVRMLDFSGGGQPSAPRQPRAQSVQAGDQIPAPNDGGAPGYDMSQMRAGQPGGAFSFALPEKPDKPDATEVIAGQRGPNGGLVVLDRNKQTTAEVPLPKGTKAVMTPQQIEADKDRHVRQSELQDARDTRKTEADQKRADAQQVRENQAAKDHEAAGIKKQAMQSMAQGFHDAAGTDAGETYFPPRYVNGIVVPGPATRMPSDKDQLADRRKALESAASGFEQTARTHQAEQERIEKAHGWGRFAPSGQTPAPTSANPVPRAPAQSSPVQPLARPASAAGPQAGRGSSGTSGPPAAPAAGPVEGTIIRSRQTGARQILRGGQWQPL